MACCRVTNLLWLLLVTATVSDTAENCDERVGNFPDPERPCSDHFYTCTSDHKYYSHHCDPHLYFDPTLNMCNSIEFVESCRSKTTVSTGETTAATTVTIDPFCRDRPAGNYNDPASNCSQMFVNCNEKKEITYRWCSAGYYFSGADDKCMKLEDLPACMELLAIASGKKETTVSSDVKSTTTEISLQDQLTTASENLLEMETSTRSRINLPITETDAISCNNRIGNFPDPVDPCSDHFFTCTSDGLLFKHFCDRHLIFDSTLKMCNSIKFVKDCQPEAVTSASTATRADFCDDKTIGFYYPDPASNCSQFYIECTDKKKGEYRLCPGDRYYSDIYRACLPKEKVAGCVKQEPAGSEVSAMIPKFSCENRQPGNYPDPTKECSRLYFVCVDSKTSVTKWCPAGQFFDGPTDQCLDADKMPWCAE